MKIERWPWFVRKPTFQRTLAHPQKGIALIWLHWRVCWVNEKPTHIVENTMPGLRAGGAAPGAGA